MHAEMPHDEGLAIQCPVCRATQTARQTCRRCNADLTLFVHVSDSSQVARRLLERALAAGDVLAAARLRDYLRWLNG